MRLCRLQSYEAFTPRVVYVVRSETMFNPSRIYLYENPPVLRGTCVMEDARRTLLSTHTITACINTAASALQFLFSKVRRLLCRSIGNRMLDVS